MEAGMSYIFTVKNRAHEAMMQSGLLMSEDDRRFTGFWTLFTGLVKADMGDDVFNNLLTKVDVNEYYDGTTTTKVYKWNGEKYESNH